MAAPSSPKSRSGASPKKKGQPGHRPQKFLQTDDMVALDKLFKEMHGRLEAAEILPAEYRLNPLTAEVLTKKPTQVTSSRKVTTQEFEDAQALLGTCFPIKDLDRPPPEKYELPMTSSQEYGWCSQPLVKPKKLFTHSRQSCEITQFAAAYFECMKTTPFSKKGFVPRYKLKQQNAQQAVAQEMSTIQAQQNTAPVVTNQTDKAPPPLPAPP